MEDGGGPSKYLSGLPSRGLFSSAVLSSNQGGMRVYVCDHDTSPPAKQHILTNPSNILIQTLQANKQKSELKHLKHKDVAGGSKTKRSSESATDADVPTKKFNTSSSSGSPDT